MLSRMMKWAPPAIDEALSPRSGNTREGQPLSLNRAPAPDLDPWIARLYATVVEAPEDHRLDCGLFNDTSIIRIQLRGRWRARTRDGDLEHERAALVFGPQSKLMPVSVTGTFISVGISLRPGAGHALGWFNAANAVDRLLPCEDFGLSSAKIFDRLDQYDDPVRWLDSLESMCREFIAASGGRQPDPISTRFEALAYADPGASVADFARECSVDLRRLERIVRRDFGLPPKQVLRRARALDMASSLRGVADRNEAEDLALRFYDQSHLIREFTDLFGMSPRQFVAKPQPILTLALESRQARRLEMIDRLSPGQSRPWAAG
jgi:AraC-like DNA-binding protein